MPASAIMDETERLLTEASNGDAVAVDQLLERYLPGLRAFVRLRTGKVIRAKESSSDLVQSVCREVLQNAGRFRYGGETGFKQWLYRTALRKIADRNEYYRAAKRNVGREVPQSPVTRSGTDEDLVACYESFCTPSHHAGAREMLERIESAFDQLNEDYRDVILQARVLGLPRAEIARRMRRSEGAVNTLLSRALAQLAELLDEE